MKYFSFLFLLTFLTSNPVFANWFQNIGNGLADVVTLGDAGRQRDREAAQHEYEMTQLAKQNAIRERDQEIGRLQRSIEKTKIDIDEEKQIQKSQDDLFESLKNVSELFTKQLSGEVTAEIRNDNMKESVEDMGKDLTALKFVFDNVLDPNLQPVVLQVLQQVAQARQLTIADFVARTIEQTQANKDNLLDINKRVSALLINYPATQTLQQTHLNAKLTDLETDQAKLKSLIDAINAENAAAEAARIQKEKDDEASRQAADRARDEAFDRAMHSKNAI